MKEYKGYGSKVIIDGDNIIVKGMLGLHQEYKFEDILDITYTEPTIMKNGVLLIQTANVKVILLF